MALQNTLMSGFRLSLQRMLPARLCNLSGTHISFYSQHRRLVSRKKFVSILHSNYLRYTCFQLFYKPLADSFNLGPRFSLVVFQYYLHRSATSLLPTIVFFFGIVRTISCGGWVYVT